LALHFTRAEYARRMTRLQQAMAARRLDCMLLFAQESMYWLTGYDTFGFCFFQCLVVKRDGQMVLLTRAPDLRQAQHTSILANIAIWTDRAGAEPVADLMNILGELGLAGARIGVETDTAGLNARHGSVLFERLRGLAEAIDASALVPALRAVKSQAEIEHVRRAGELADLALDAALKATRAGADEGDILAAMHAAIFSAGGDYPGNPFILGSGRDALLCRYKAGRRKLSAQDQLTLEWAGVWAHYHAAMMRTIVVGRPTRRHRELYAASREALLAVRDAMVVGRPVSDMFDAHARVLDAAGLSRHRLNACGYSLGATFGPSWMDTPMLYAGNDLPVEPNMVLFLHMIVFDSDSETAMTLGQTWIAARSGPQSLSRHEIDLIVR
jgi:Xaa-Pro dipeptidase